MKQILFIGGPGNLSEHTIDHLLGNPDNRIAIFTRTENPDRAYAGKVDFFKGNRENNV